MSCNFDFEGKVIIVTGSTSGIGKDAAVSFAKSGAQVVVTGRDQSRGKLTVQQCINVSPNKSGPLFVEADLSKVDDCNKIIRETEDKFGQIDVLINNAGIMIPGHISSQNFTSVLDEVYAVNVRAVVHLTKLAEPYLAKTQGVVINISSVGSVMYRNVSFPLVGSERYKCVM